MNRQRAKQTILAVVLLGISGGFVLGPWEGVGLAALVILIDSWLPAPKRGKSP